MPRVPSLRSRGSAGRPDNGTRGWVKLRTRIVELLVAVAFVVGGCSSDARPRLIPQESPATRVSFRRDGRTSCSGKVRPPSTGNQSPSFQGRRLPSRGLLRMAERLPRAWMVVASLDPRGA
jgi:hypothetical protein